MSTALGGFNWSPAQFWEATPHEFFACAEYHQRQNAKLDRD